MNSLDRSGTFFLEAVGLIFCQPYPASPPQPPTHSRCESRGRRGGRCSWWRCRGGRHGGVAGGRVAVGGGPWAKIPRALACSRGLPRAATLVLEGPGPPKMQCLAFSGVTLMNPDGLRWAACGAALGRS